MQPRSIRAFAKINIGLLVTNRRPDGYHDLLTVFHRIDLADELLLQPAGRISVSSSTPDVPSDETNLCHRAARLLGEACGARAGVSIALIKHIPVGAGLGGGSSDAAALLRCLPGIWGLEIDERRLARLAAQLGSDVPYFLQAGSALAGGRGDQLEYFRLDIPYTVVLCMPGIHVSTPWAYGQIRLTPGRRCPDLRRAVIAGMQDPERLRREAVNDFEEPVFAAFPALGALKRRLLDAGAVYASLSGSGSSVYGFFPSPAGADTAAGQLRADGCAVAVTPPFFHPPSAACL